MSSTTYRQERAGLSDSWRFVIRKLPHVSVNTKGVNFQLTPRLVTSGRVFSRPPFSQLRANISVFSTRLR